MRKQILHKVLLLLLGLTSLGLIVFLPKPAQAANPATINFQGKIVNSNGTNITDGTYSVVFRIYNTASPTMTTACTTTASCLWQETQASVSVTNSIFQVELGSACSLTSASCNNAAGGPVNYSSSNSLYLTMQFDGDTSGANGGFMSPLIHINSVPFALQSDNSASLGNIAAANYVQLATGNVQTDTTSNDSLVINKTGASGDILLLEANSKKALEVNNSGTVLLGQAGASGLNGTLTFNNSVGSNTVSLALQADPGASYTLLLPTTGPSTSQCLQTDATTATQLKFAACSAGGSSTLATAYTTGASSTDQTILLSSVDGGGIIIKDNASSVGNAFQVQNSDGFNLLATDTSDSVVSIGGNRAPPSGVGVVAGSNSGGSLSGSSSTTYYYKVSAVLANGETPASSEVSINGASFTPLSAPGAPTAAVGAAGNVTGTYTYKVTFITANGETTEGTASGSVSPSSQQVSLTSIPLGPSGTTGRNIYRCDASGLNCLRLSSGTTLTNNTSTTKTDNTASYSGNPAPPVSNTATTNLNIATVSWNSVSGASTYHIYRSIGSGTQTSYQVSASSPFSDTGAYGTVGLASGDTTARLGIGTTAPAASLDVVGTASFQSKNDSTNAFQVQNSTGLSLLNVDSSGYNLAFLGGNNGATSPWTDQAANKLPVIRTRASSVVANGYVYVLGGWTGTGTGSTAQDTVFYAKLNADGSTGPWTDQATNKLPEARGLINKSSVVANGYVYVTGGQNSAGSSTNTIFYTRLNADGSTGPWTNQANNKLPSNRFNHITLVSNGYIYVIAGNPSDTIYYAKLNADGSTGPWTDQATNKLPDSRRNAAGVVANGYIYVIGGSSGPTTFNSVFYAKLNADGSTGPWTDQATNKLPDLRSSSTSVVSNGYIYIIGGADGSAIAQNSVYYAKLNADGSTGPWTDEPVNKLPGTRAGHESVVANGYIYVLDGSDDTTTEDTIFYASLPRVQINASIDLVGLQGGTLADGSGTMGIGSYGGSITAGNIMAVGNLQIQGQANFTQSVGILGNISATGSALFQDSSNSTSAFQVQNSGGDAIVVVDTTPVNSILSNSSFENTDISAWLPNGAGSVSRTTAEAFLGSASLAIPVTGLGEGTKYITGNGANSLTTSSTYTLSWYEKSSLDTGSLSSASYDRDGPGGSAAVTCTNIDSLTSSWKGWTRRSCQIITDSTTPASTAYFQISLGIGATQTFYIDAVQLELSKTPTPYKESNITLNGIINSPVIIKSQSDSTNAFQLQNAVGSAVFTIDTNPETTSSNREDFTNPSFEGTILDWSYSGAAGGSAVISSQASYIGERSLKLVSGTSATANDGIKYVTGSSIPKSLFPSSTYTISWYDKLSSGSLSTVIASYDRDGSGANAPVDCTSINTQAVSTTSWTRHYCTITPDGTGPASDAYIIIRQGDTTTRTLFIDAVKITRSSSLLPFIESKISLNGVITSPAVFAAQSNSTTAFQIQNASNSTIFGVDTANFNLFLGNTTNSNQIKLVSGVTSTTYSIILPTATSGGTNYCLVGTNSSGITTTSWVPCGANTTATVTLTPEYQGAVLTADGNNNTGTMTSDFCSGSGVGGLNINASVCGTGTGTHNYYSWTANATNDYDIWLRWQAPSDFDSFGSNAFTLNGWTSSTSDSAALTVYDSSNTSCGTGTVSTAAVWGTAQITPSGCSFSAGNVLTFKIHMNVAVNAEFARAGEITITYSRN